MATWMIPAGAYKLSYDGGAHEFKIVDAHNKSKRSWNTRTIR